MGVGCSHGVSHSPPINLTSTLLNPCTPSTPLLFFTRKPSINNHSRSPSLHRLKCVQFLPKQALDDVNFATNPLQSVSPDLLRQMVYDALVWTSLNGFVVGDRSLKKSGTVPGVGMVHAPFSLLPVNFPESHWRQACELAPIFNELVDRVSLDGKFLQEALARTKKVDAFTRRLLEIHSKMLEMNKKEEIVLGLHRSDYMLDDRTKNLLQIELNTISSSFAGLSCVVSELHRTLLNQYGKYLELDFNRVPQNTAVTGFAEALAQAWKNYNNSRAVVIIVVQPEEPNMYDQHWLSMFLREKHGVRTIRRTLAEIDSEGQLLPDGTLLVDGCAVAVIYFRAGYAPSDYPSESVRNHFSFCSLFDGFILLETCDFHLTGDAGGNHKPVRQYWKLEEWRARLLMEQSSAIKCPSISYHLTGTKKIQQELAKPNILERFLENKDDIAKLRKCFAGLWSLDDSNIIKEAIERPELFVLKPQREGGGNNIYGNDVREILMKLQKEDLEELNAYILMQRIFPVASSSLLVREGIFHQEETISELGIYGAYLRNKDKVIMNDNCGYLVRTKVSSSNEGGVAAGFAVLDSIYVTD